MTDDMYTTHFPNQHTCLIAVKQEQGTTDSRQAGEETETDSAAGPESHRSRSAHETHKHKHMAPEERGAAHNDALTDDSGCKKKKKRAGL